MAGQNRDTPDLARCPFQQDACRADGYVVGKGDEVQRLAVAAVALICLGDVLFVDEDAGANVQYGLHVGGFGAADHAKYPSRMRR